MNMRTILHRDYTVEYSRTADRTEVIVDVSDMTLVYGTDRDMTLLDISRELLEEIQKFLRADPDADEYYHEYSTEELYKFMDALKRTIKEEE